MILQVRNVVWITVLSMALAAVTACGGGGGGSSPPAIYTIGGTVSGLDAGQSVLLQLNGGNDQKVDNNGAFTFASKIADGGAYAVTAVGGPSGKTCRIYGGEGTAYANVNVDVACIPITSSIGGAVSGLSGQGFKLALGYWIGNYMHTASFLVVEQIDINKNGQFAFPTFHPSTLNYTILVRQQPHSPAQRCVVRNADVTIVTATITDVEVVCSEFSYVANALDNTVSAFSIDAATGAIASVGPPVSTGVSPLAIAGTSDKKYVYVANSGSNDISAFSVDPGTGALTAVPGSPFPAGTTPIALALHYDEFLYVANSGSDDLSVYQVDQSNGALTPLAPCATCSSSTGAGPSAIAITPYKYSGNPYPSMNLFTANTRGSNISAFNFDRNVDGGLDPAPGSPFSSGSNISTLAFGAGGQFLYTADASGATASIDGFIARSDANPGALIRLSGFPLSLPSCTFIVADQTGAYLYATTGTDLLGYSINATTGALTALSGFPIAVGAGVRSVSIDPTNQFLYVANGSAGTVTSYTLNAATGALTLMPGSPFTVGTSADYIATF